MYFNITTYVNAKQGLQLFMFGNEIYSNISKFKNFTNLLCKKFNSKINIDEKIIRTNTKILSKDYSSEIPKILSDMNDNDYRNISPFFSDNIEPVLRGRVRLYNQDNKNQIIQHSQNNDQVYFKIKSNSSISNIQKCNNNENKSDNFHSQGHSISESEIKGFKNSKLLIIKNNKI